VLVVALGTEGRGVARWRRRSPGSLGARGGVSCSGSLGFLISDSGDAGIPQVSVRKFDGFLNESEVESVTSRDVLAQVVVGFAPRTPTSSLLLDALADYLQLEARLQVVDEGVDGSVGARDWVDHMIELERDVRDAGGLRISARP